MVSPPCYRGLAQEEKLMNKLYESALRYSHMTVAGTDIARDGQAKLHRVTINSGTLTTLDVFNGPDASSPLVAVVDCSSAGTLDYFGVPLASGLSLRLNGDADVTVIYE
jgi:hypothetical protein